VPEVWLGCWKGVDPAGGTVVLFSVVIILREFLSITQIRYYKRDIPSLNLENRGGREEGNISESVEHLIHTKCRHTNHDDDKKGKKKQREWF
jgi:hypothetical protein